MIKTVLFDLDDTLLDFHRSERVALSETLLQFGIEPSDATIKRYSEINRAMWEQLELGNMTREEGVENGETTVMEMAYTYDEQGRMIERVTTYSDDEPMTLVLVYDEQGRNVKQTYNTGYGEFVFEYVYNENGDVVKETFTNSEGEINVLETKYVLLYVTDNFSDQTEEILNDHWIEMI
jgi:FMN phosphatase YigB (HAD superfamily)